MALSDIPGSNCSDVGGAKGSPGTSASGASAVAAAICDAVARMSDKALDGQSMLRIKLES